MTDQKKTQPFFAVDGPMGGFSTEEKAKKAISHYSSIVSVLIVGRLMLSAVVADNVIIASVAFIMIIIGIAAYFQNKLCLWLLSLAALVQSGSNIYLKVLIGGNFISGIIIDVVLIYSGYRLMRGLMHKE